MTLQKSAMWVLALIPACLVSIAAAATSSGASSGSSSGSTSGSGSGSADDAMWQSVLEVGEVQGMLTQRMTMEFLLIAYGVDPVTNRQHLAHSIESFDNTLTDLLNGNADRNIM